MSLARSDYVAMQSSIATIGGELKPGLGSEEVLATRHYSSLGIADCVRLIRAGYDDSLKSRFGGELLCRPTIYSC